MDNREVDPEDGDNLEVDPEDGDNLEVDPEDDDVHVIVFPPKLLQEIEEQNRRSLMVMLLNPKVQKMVPMSAALRKAWQLTGSVECRVVVDDSKALFQFESESDLLWVLDQEPWSFNDWMLVVDRFDQRDDPDYLRFISFWVEIIGIPWNYRNDVVIKEIGSHLGEVLEIHDKGPGVRARIRIDVDERLQFERRVLFGRSDEAVEVRFVYEKLKMFCRTCGSLNHHEARCPH